DAGYAKPWFGGDASIFAARGVQWTFFALLLVFLAIVGHTDYSAETGLVFANPAATFSDEPYYLIGMNSILFHHDLVVSDDFRRVRAGSADAGEMMRSSFIDHHTIIVNRRTGRRTLASANDPMWGLVRCDPEFTARTDTYGVPSHPVG